MLGSCAGRRFREEVRNEQETTPLARDADGRRVALVDEASTWDVTGRR